MLALARLKKRIPSSPLPSDVTCLDDFEQGCSSKEDDETLCQPTEDPETLSQPLEDLEFQNMVVKECGCKQQCLLKFMQAPQAAASLFQMRHQTQVGNEDSNLLLLNLVKAAKEGGIQSQAAWMLCGLPLCRQGFLNAMALSKNRLERIEKAISLGHLKPLPDQRAYNGSNLSHQEKAWSVDSWMTFVYEYMAEPLAEEDRVVHDMESAGHANLVHEW
eukprot:1475187-Amphidinium_carterae.1